MLLLPLVVAHHAISCTVGRPQLPWEPPAAALLPWEPTGFCGRLPSPGLRSAVEAVGCPPVHVLSSSRGPTLARAQQLAGPLSLSLSTLRASPAHTTSSCVVMTVMASWPNLHISSLSLSLSLYIYI
uniref:Secreted protein n=1 Tax=Myotis myotis TaxID=51298 RepID=A0A7J7Z587_MYOMY|nr:hypothetical protein mMyoMyo1_010728 [Myotis myotis]